MVSEAITAPGPKMASQRSGFAASNDAGTAGHDARPEGWGFTDGR